MSDGMESRSRPTHMDVCSGVGGFSLGLAWAGWRTVCYVEQDEWCQRLLMHRMREGDLDDALLWDDLKTFRGESWRGRVDLLTAGFPCTPFSCAGQRKAEADERNLWPDVERVIDEVRPGYVLLENSPGILGTGRATFGRILGFFSETGYRVEWQTVPCASFGAPHIRFRTWVVAHADRPERREDSRRLDERDGADRGREETPVDGPAESSDAESERLPIGDGGAGDRPQAAQPERCGDAPADPDNERQERRGRSGTRVGDEPADGSLARSSSPDSDRARLEIFPSSPHDFRRECETAARGVVIRGWGTVEPRVRGVDVRLPEGVDAAALWSAWPDCPGLIGPGLPNRRQRLEGLGNTVSPVLIYWLGCRILRHMRGDR